MTRLFVALSLPEAVAQQIMLIQGGVPGARWQTRDQLHLTLRFVGEVDGQGAAMLDDALAGILAPAFTLQLHGVGQFGREHRAARSASSRATQDHEHRAARSASGRATQDHEHRAARSASGRATQHNYQPHALWAGPRPSAALEHLQRKVDNAIRRVGRPQDVHKFMPHVTLARLRDADPARLIEWLTYNALFTSHEFPVAAFHLYSSRVGDNGSVYAREKSYALETGNGKTDD